MNLIKTEKLCDMPVITLQAQSAWAEEGLMTIIRLWKMGLLVRSLLGDDLKTR